MTERGVLAHGSICAGLLAASALLLACRHTTLAGACWLAAGAGGIGAAWSRYSEQSGAWLRLSAFSHRPDRQTRHCFAEHVPLVAGGLALLYLGNRRRC